LTVIRGRFRSDPPELTAQPLRDPQVELYRSTNHSQNWLDCIKERRDPVANAETGHRGSRFRATMQ
jgi:hypothetical protein